MFSKQAANSLVTETSQYFVFFCRSVCSANLAKCLIINVLRLIIVILFFIAFLNITYVGRNISVTHVALGTVRVMRTTGMMGEVVGMAASLCKKYNTTPRGVYQKHLPELKALMKEGVGKKEGIPDNQKFNEQKLLKKPRIFAIEKNKK